MNISPNHSLLFLISVALAGFCLLLYLPESVHVFYSPTSPQQRKNTSLVIVMGGLRGGEQSWKTLYKNAIDVDGADLLVMIGELSNTTDNPTHSSVMADPSIARRNASGVRYVHGLKLEPTSNPIAAPKLKSTFDDEQLCAEVVQYFKMASAQYKDPAKSAKGNLFLSSVGVMLGLKQSRIELQPGREFKIKIYNCGNCTDYELCRVSFFARLVGPSLRSVEVVQGMSGNYEARFTSPLVPGNYSLSIFSRWWRGLDFPDGKKKRPQSNFLGGSGRQNFKRDEHFLQEEQASERVGSPVSLLMSAANSPDSASDHDVPACTANTIDGPGYWEETPRPELCSATSIAQHPGECWIMDTVNPRWLWRGDACRPTIRTPAQITNCLTDASIMVFGDSLVQEVYWNVVDFVPHLKNTRIFTDKSPYFGTKAPMSTAPRVYVVANFGIAHLIWHQSLDYISRVTIPTLKREWREKFGAVQAHGIFWTGYPAHSEREKYITHDRMVRANALLASAVDPDLQWRVFNTTTPLWSRPDASWDLFHFLQVHDKVGGVSKIITMMLLDYICMREGK